MDKILQTILKIVGVQSVQTLLGRLALLIAYLVGGILTGSSTSAGDAIGILTNKDRALAVCAQQVIDAPKSEIMEAVKEKAPDALPAVTSEIKPAE